MVKVLRIARLFEDDKTVLILRQNVEYIFLFVVDINQILYLLRLQISALLLYARIQVFHLLAQLCVLLVIVRKEG